MSGGNIQACSKKQTSIAIFSEYLKRIDLFFMQHIGYFLAPRKRLDNALNLRKGKLCIGIG